MSGVYASIDYREQRVHWSKIIMIAVLGLPSLVVGDFNYIMDPNEKMGGRQYVDSVDSREFRKFIDDLGLINLGYTRPRFTWYNNQLRAARIWKRIDQALATIDWLQHFPGHKVQHLLRITSDHCPILITTNGLCLLWMPFRFEKF